ncbi:MAG: hypothetical protein MJ211_13480 [Bacteroidales bacterium]|nr:hypothetical protein [Bacteroidales bacterium]
MRKIISILISIIMLTSCVSENTKKVNELLDAINSKDYTQIEKLTTELLTIKEDLTSRETTSILKSCDLLSKYYLQDSKNNQKSIDYNKLYISTYDLLSGKKDAKDAIDEAKAEGWNLTELYSENKELIQKQESVQENEIDNSVVETEKK